jgi:hypothetical protein
LLTLYYFAFFLIIMPLVGLKETPRPIPATISEPVLSGDPPDGYPPAMKKTLVR